MVEHTQESWGLQHHADMEKYVLRLIRLIS